ncbi:MAG: DUF4037 domain-containing protein [Nanoarchaeota archaeon]|nr:DUF4037 domain-containing protein [Nanoarchaeota archaeon]
MKTKNILKEVEKEINPFLKKLKEQNYVIGIVLLGGLGKRKFIDELSDIDLTIFTFDKNVLDFSLPFEFHYKLNGRVLEFNVHQQVLEKEEQRDSWNESKMEAYSRGKIIYDPTGRIKKLIKNKTKFNKKNAFNRLVWIIQQYRWRAQIHSVRSFKRGYPESSHNLLNQCSEMLLEAIYLLNKRYLPHKKWILVYLKEMKAPWNKLSKDFKNGILIKNYKLSDIKRRIRILDKIYKIILAKIKEQYKNFPEDPYEYYYQNFVQVNKKTKIDKLLSRLNKNINKKDIIKLKGYLCFDLIDTKDKLYKSMSFDSGIRRHENVIGRSIKYERKNKD